MTIAKKGDPFVTERGQVVLKSDLPREVIEVGPPIAKNISPTERRSFRDLPADDPRTQTAIIVVLSYSMLGLTINEIAHLVNVELDDVRRLQELDAYQETFEMLFSEFLSSNSGSMQARIASFMPSALQNMMDIANDAKHEVAKMRANQDLLDRGGLHHEKLHGNNSETGFDSLKIVIQDAKEEDSVRVDIDVGKKKHGNR